MMVSLVLVLMVKRMVSLVLLLAGIGVVTTLSASADAEALGPVPPPPGPPLPPSGEGADPSSTDTAGRIPSGEGSGSGTRFATATTTTTVMNASSLTRLDPSSSDAGVRYRPAQAPTIRLRPLRRANSKPRHPAQDRLTVRRTAPKYVVEPAFAWLLAVRALDAMGDGPLAEYRKDLEALRHDMNANPKEVFEAARYWLVEACIVGIDHGLNHIQKPDSMWSSDWVHRTITLGASCLTEASFNPEKTEAERYAQTKAAIKRILERPQDCWAVPFGRYYQWAHWLKAYPPTVWKSARATKAKRLCRRAMRELREEEQDMRRLGPEPPLEVLGEYFRRFAMKRRVTYRHEKRRP